MDDGGSDGSRRTFVDLLQSRASAEPNKLVYRYRADGAGVVQTMTWGELDRHARTIAVVIGSTCSPGDRALLLYPPGLDFIAAFYGCLYAGVVAVPAYPPDPSRLARTLPRLRTVLIDSSPTVALATGMIAGFVESMLGTDPDFSKPRWIATDDLAVERSTEWRRPNIDASTVAFLQYTSGSTSTPRGVKVSHANLLYQGREIGKSVDPLKMHSVTWMPVYHDFGLLNSVTQPVYLNLTTTMISPLDFLKRPRFVLETITEERATACGGPNFSYDLLVRRVPASDQEGLDLSTWEYAYCGAEPLRDETMHRFEVAFGPIGFKKSAWSPGYGLAEATLMVSFAPRGPALRETFDADALARGKVEHSVTPKSVSLVAAGFVAQDTIVEIVNPETRQICDARTVGEIWVQSPSVSQGYWNKTAEENDEVFRASTVPESGTHFLRTGDLGFRYGGQLFIAGRLKDLLIIRGRNVYPQDIELSVERELGVRPGCTAAFLVETSGNEELVIVAEVERRQAQIRRASTAVPDGDRRIGDRRVDAVPDATPEEVRLSLEDLIERIQHRVVREHDLVPAHVVLVTAGTIFKTTSGKIQRQATRQAFLEKTLEVVAKR